MEMKEIKYYDSMGGNNSRLNLWPRSWIFKFIAFPIITCMQVSQRSLEVSQWGAQSEEGVTIGLGWVGDNPYEGDKQIYHMKTFSKVLILLIMPSSQCQLSHILQDIPQQMNGSDCGMFACKFSEYLSRYDRTMKLLSRGSSGLRLSEFVQISEFFQFYITDICQISESFAKSVNLE